MQWSFLLRRYRVTQVELFALLCRLADELLFRQISWIKKLPFFCELSIEDYTRLLSATWQELILLACLTVYSAQVLGDLANVTDKYTPSDDELQRWGMYSLCHSPFIHSSIDFQTCSWSVWIINKNQYSDSSEITNKNLAGPEKYLLTALLCM